MAISVFNEDKITILCFEALREGAEGPEVMRGSGLNGRIQINGCFGKYWKAKI